jgi:hypothetical protein
MSKEIEEGDILIGQFMGASYGEDDPNEVSRNGYIKLPDDSEYLFPHWTVRFSWVEELKYHSSLDWLMPVIDKLKSVTEEPEDLDTLKDTLWWGTILDVWKECVELIKEYNKNKSV